MSIRIQHVSESFVRIEAEQGILREVADHFKFRVDGYQFMPAYKAGVFDGYIRFLNTRTGLFPKGLVPDLIDWCDEQVYTPKLSPEFSRFRERIEFDISKLQLPFAPHDYQELAVNRFLDKKRQVILASTGAGKSFIIYLIARAMLQENKKMLVIVPSIGLVTQLASDFDDYAQSDSEFEPSMHIHKIMSGKEKHNRQEITISTWQSLQRLPAEFFEEFDCVICDEVHTAKAKQISVIMEKCSNAFYRLGLTGTLDDAEANEMTIKSHFGPVFRVTNTKDLMDRGVLSSIEINGIILKYPEHIAKHLQGLPYAQEMDFIVRHHPRNKLISRFTVGLPGNTLLLFRYVQKHGKLLEQLLIDLCKQHGKELYFVYGGTDAEDREKVRKLAEKKSNIIICASLPVFQAGVNIKNLHNVVFASSNKSKISILQSVGRGLRLHESKDKMRLYDFTDDLRGGRKAMNYSLKHFVERIQLYQKEQFPVKVIELELESDNA